MELRKGLDQTASRGCWAVACDGGTRFVLDLDSGAVLREPSHGRRLPWDGKFVRGAQLVDDVTGLPMIRVGASARWQLVDGFFVFTGRITQIAQYRAPARPRPTAARVAGSLALS